MDALSQLLSTFRLKTDLINNGQYCGNWAVDTSGTGKASFHIVAHSACYLRSDAISEPLLLEKGDFVLFPRDSKHLLSNTSQPKSETNQQQSTDYNNGIQNDGVGLICGYFHFKQNAASSLMDTLPDAMIIRRKGANGNLALLMDLMVSESLKTTSGATAAVDRLAEAFFVIALREQLANDQHETGLSAALRDPRIHKALLAIQTEPQRKWTVDKLAELVAMSRSSFAEHFKSLLGESPMEYITRWRMQVAYNLLDEDGMTVLEVADRCGYESEASFSKAFKRIIGEGPGAVRKQAA
ncbi:MAG: cupin domain-containing protein [Cellvibrionaceae bacterium]